MRFGKSDTQNEKPIKRRWTWLPSSELNKVWIDLNGGDDVADSDHTERRHRRVAVGCRIRSHYSVHEIENCVRVAKVVGCWNTTRFTCAESLFHAENNVIHFKIGIKNSEQPLFISLFCCEFAIPIAYFHLHLHQNSLSIKNHPSFCVKMPVLATTDALPLVTMNETASVFCLLRRKSTAVGWASINYFALLVVRLIPQRQLPSN